MPATPDRLFLDAGVVMSRIEAADWSKFQPRHTSANMLALKNAGIGLIIPGAWHGDAHGINPRCKDDLRLAREAGLHTATYTVLDSPQGTTAAGAVQKARQVCGEEWQHLSFVAVDVEVTGITIPEIATALTEVERMGQRPIIYTAYWFWHDRFGNPDNFKDVPLWNAYYDKDPDFDFAHLPYGGWTIDDVVGTQYEGTTTFVGVEMDRNSFLREFVENGERDMTTYKLFSTWNPPRLWLIAYVADVPIYRRWIVTQPGAQALIAAVGQPETIGLDQLATIPSL